MLNKAMLIGNLGDDPAIRQLNSGKPVANFSLATNQRWTDDNGDMHDHTEWHRVVCFEKLAKVAADYLRKGRQVYVEGKIRTRQWDKGGTRMFTTEIVASRLQLLGPKPADVEAEVEPEIAEAA